MRNEGYVIGRMEENKASIHSTESLGVYKGRS